MQTADLTRRGLLASLSVMVIAPTVSFAADETLRVAKSPTCGCCGAWVEHMRSAGFHVEVTDVDDETLQALKTSLGIEAQHASCHTARIGGYFVEGHVPASDVKRLLVERPDGLGLSVPGMPVGSPGMEMGNRRDPYDTVLVKRSGTAVVFEAHR